MIELLGFDQLFVGDFQDGARWLVQRWAEWYVGPTLGSWFAEVAFEVAETIYPTNTPWYEI